MSALRPLPPRPNLEFEHKEAKALLRRLRAGDPDSLVRARARHPAIDALPRARIRLADAQLVIAREYGFTSWPRLVSYFRDVERQRHGWKHAPGDSYDGWVRTLIVEHSDHRTWAGREFAAYVPRFYGMRLDDVFASTVTEEDARVAVARLHGFPSWDALLESSATELKQRTSDWDVDPMRNASKAIGAIDLEELRRVVDAHPELLHPPEYEASRGRRLLKAALHHERRQGQAALRPIIDWLLDRGLDLQHELNTQLCGHMNITVEKVRWLLERGANPNWVAPNGVPVLEHALIRYRNAEAVDLVAARVRPRKALWIAAGLGDVDGVSRFLDSEGKPTQAARRLRPNFDAVGPGTIPSHPDPDDEEVLMEAFFVALLNGRTAVLEYMASRGFPVNSLVWGAPLIVGAVGDALVPIVECLVRCGADLDLRGWRPQLSAREVAREFFENAPQDAARRRILALCGMDPDAIPADRGVT